MRDGVIVISRRVLLRAALVAVAFVALGALVLVPGPREALARALFPVATADPATLARQRTAAEHSLQRGYAKATGQLKQVLDLTLAITRTEADAIAQKARADITTTRRQALAAVGTATGLAAGQLEPYVLATEAALDQGDFENEPGILLAPGLFDIVRRADALFQQTADEAIRQLARAPGSPSPTARPSATSSPSSTRSASPSPSGR